MNFDSATKGRPSIQHQRGGTAGSWQAPAGGGRGGGWGAHSFVGIALNMVLYYTEVVT